MDYTAQRVYLEVQYRREQHEHIETIREDLILQEKAAKREQNKAVIAQIMKDNGFQSEDVARGLSVLNTIFQSTDLSLGELFDGLSENLLDSHPKEATAAEELWTYCDSVDA
ncbi:MAG: hypothetical protein KME29_31340 [Calothrix sp. FI2-JRJ7]|jgi:hypothetical protein|nr:hypothetical protein [Calothrix sp. FI2-JRJ7]